tara:strand:+ start:74 stop:946 length:873 start_codon:yes stop_codon:yes gene_type:complete
MFAKLVFLLAESFRALFRAKLHAVISSITIGIALVIFSLAYLTYINLLGYSYEFKSKYRIEVFFESNLDLNEARDLFNTILVIEGIEQGEFVDKEKAAKLFKSFFKEDVNEIVGDNPLPMGGRFDITENYRKFDRMGAIVKQIRYLSGVDVASFQQGIISRVDTIVENILGASMLLGLVIFFIAVILVSNTIRLIIHAKQDAIETMHLLGATNSFIRFPFVIEGIIQGLLGAIFSLSILYLLRSLQVYLLEPLIKIPIVEPANLIIYNIIFGLVLALIGSYRGISKYLPR